MERALPKMSGSKAGKGEVEEPVEVTGETLSNPRVPSRAAKSVAGRRTASWQ